VIARRSPAIAASLVALAIAGCGLGEGDEAGEVSLTVTRDYGSRQELARTVEITESDTVLRILDRSTEITTRYGGGFVESINGLEGERRGGRFFDWFFYVNGIESSIGAADYTLDRDERIWWDHRDWTAAMHAPAVVGSFPEPFAHGYEGERHPTEVICRTAVAVCREVEGALGDLGARLGGGDDAIRVLVGPWSRLRSDPIAARLERGPQFSGVFVEIVRRSGGFRFLGLGTDGEPRRAFAATAGLVAATRRYEQPPTWLLTGTTAAGVRAAADALVPSRLRNRYAVGVEGGRTIPVPIG
jgi:hypothetical protein